MNTWPWALGESGRLSQAFCVLYIDAASRYIEGELHKFFLKQVEHIIEANKVRKAQEASSPRRVQNKHWGLPQAVKGVEADCGLFNMSEVVEHAYVHILGFTSSL